MSSPFASDIWEWACLAAKYLRNKLSSHDTAACHERDDEPTTGRSSFLQRHTGSASQHCFPPLFSFNEECSTVGVGLWSRNSSTNLRLAVRY